MPVQVNPPDAGILSERAQQIEECIDLHFVDGSGKLRSAICHETMQPFEHGYFEDPTGSLPGDLIWMTKLYNGDAITHWLWAYWEATAKYGANPV